MKRNLEEDWRTRAILDSDSEISTDEEFNPSHDLLRRLPFLDPVFGSPSSAFTPRTDYCNNVKKIYRGYTVNKSPRPPPQNEDAHLFTDNSSPRRMTTNYNTVYDLAGPSNLYEIEDLSTNAVNGQDLTIRCKRKSSKYPQDGKRVKEKWRVYSSKPISEEESMPVDNQEVIVVDDYPRDTQDSSVSNIQVVEPLPEEPQLSTPVDKHAELNRTLLKLLECPVCLEFMSPPIHHCKRGHLVCKTCKTRLDSCPYCRSRLCETRNLAMEQVAESLLYPCEFFNAGCQAQILLREKLAHENNCEFRIYSCIFEGCCWKGQHKEILNHMLEDHSSKVLHGNEHSLNIRLVEMHPVNWFMSAFNSMFHINVSYSNTEINMCVKFIGPVESSNKFMYTIDIACASPVKRSISFTRQTHRCTEKILNIMNFGEAFHLRFDTARMFMPDGFLKCNVIVLQI